MLAVLMGTMRMQRKRRLINEKMYSSTCRTCLSTEELHPIFYGKSSEKKRSEELYTMTGLEIKLNDGMPQMICTQCLHFMNEALRFRRTAEKAHRKLIDVGFRKPVKKVHEISKVEITVTDNIKTDATEILLFDELNNKTEFNNDYSLDNTYGDDFQQNDYLDNIDNSYETPNCKSKKVKEPTVYECDVCNKEFKMKNTYKAHMRFHTNFCVCELCGKKCRNNNLLLLHKRGRHGMDRIHKCSYCDYSAANKEALIIHERRHTGEKPYVCDHCGASFHRRSNLVQHIAIHLPEKNFQCEQCNKKFHSKKFLRSHKFKSHQTRRYTYVCHLCGSQFTSTDSARKHLTRAHGIPRDAQPPVSRIPNASIHNM